MNFKDRFDHLAAEVERLVDYDNVHGYRETKDIISYLMSQEGETARSLNEFFQNIAGISLNKYIKDRKMMAMYKQMMRDAYYDAQSYIACTGYGNESSFSTAFSEKFGISPTNAFERKDRTNIESPISIDSIIRSTDKTNEEEKNKKKIYGLPKDIIDRYNEICEYQALFGLEDKFVELAVFLNEEKGSDLKEAFKTVDTLIMDYKFVTMRPDLDRILDYIDMIVPVVYVKHLYPDVCLTELNEWYLYMKDEGGNLVNDPPELVRAFIDDISAGIPYMKLKELYNDYHENYSRKYSFREYIEYNDMCGSVEEYEDFIVQVCEDCEVNELSDLDSSDEDNKRFWAAYDERHFKNM